MKIVYHAENAMDANIVKGVIEAAGIYADVRGEGIQSAVGEAAAMNNVKVWVHDNDYPEARDIVVGWQSAEFIDDDAELFEGDDYPEEPINSDSHLIRDVCIAVVIVLLFVAATIEL